MFFKMIMEQWKYKQHRCSKIQKVNAKSIIKLGLTDPNFLQFQERTPSLYYRKTTGSVKDNQYQEFFSPISI